MLNNVRNAESSVQQASPARDQGVMNNSPFAAAAATASQAGGNSVIETKKALQATAQGRGKTIDFRTAGVGEYVQLLSKTPRELAAFVKAQLRTDINQPGSSLIQLNNNLPEGVLAAAGDGKIFVSPDLMGQVNADGVIREEIAEIIYQTLFNSTSQGDFGAEVVLRLNSPDGRVSPQDIKNLRAENDVIKVQTRDGVETVEAAGGGRNRGNGSSGQADRNNYDNLGVSNNYYPGESWHDQVARVRASIERTEDRAERYGVSYGEMQVIEIRAIQAGLRATLQATDAITAWEDRN